MDQVEIAVGLGTLGYSEKWMAYGFLDEETLGRQMMIFDTGEDRDTEHYRYGAFCHVFGRNALSDIELDQFLELVEDETDEAMVSAVQYQLIDWTGLTSEQRSYLRRHEMFVPGRFQRQFDIHELKLKLASPLISRVLFDACMAIGDETLQRRIVEHHGVTRAQLEYLVETGKSKAVRNMASSRLRRMAQPPTPP